FTLPQPLARVVSRLPAYPPTLAFVQAVNLALGDMLRSDRLDDLRGKTIRIRVKDGGLTLDFVLARKGLVACKQTTKPDLTISANAYDFLVLALRREDPDTLFFSRRLLMEGDTELGLLVKNTLDALELPPLDWRLLTPRHVFGELKHRVFG
ncbi:MAG TPA: SCP2 sterol-binding domain-containing protein, partial [Gallionellaceae bacterium]|nr:SCP2 sterol-binding domain-containing protein [Gallionellaceae bacterium]